VTSSLLRLAARHWPLIASRHPLEGKLKALGKPCEMHIYPGTDDAFFNDTRPEVYDAQAAADARRGTVRFFRQHLSHNDESEA